MKRSTKVLYFGIYCAWIFFFRTPVHANNLFVANRGTDTVEEFNPASTGTVFASGLDSPSGLAFDGAGNLYVASWHNSSIEKFNSSGGVLSSNGTVFATRLSSQQLISPLALAFDAAGDLYVANSGNTIEKFSYSGGALSSTGTVFENSGTQTGIEGLAFDSVGNLYGANFNNNIIVKFNTAGIRTVFANSGLDSPSGLTFDSKGNLYVANSGGDTIEEFRLSGGVLSSNGTVFASGLFNPVGLAFDGAGNLYVGNMGNNTIEEFNSSGGVLSSNGMVFASSGLDGPEQLAFQPVPEPSTWFLVTLGAVTLISSRRLRRGWSLPASES